jgi:hypothetical protein
MDRTVIGPADWTRQWLGMLDRLHPGWGKDYDLDAFALAAEDLFGRSAPPVAPEELDALAEMALDPDAAAADPALGQSPAFRRALIEFEYIFRAGHGSSLDDASLRQLRAESFRRLVDAAREPAGRRIGRILHALDMRERRRARREPGIPEGAPLRDRREVRPEAAALGREAAWRTALRAARDLSAPVLEALRRFLSDAEGRPAREAAAESGISPATMSRALRRLGELAVEELEGCPDECLRPFTDSLVDFLGEVAS